MAYDINDPKNSGLLNAALTMLALSGPSSQKKTFGSILGASGLSGMDEYRNSRRQQILEAEEARRAKISELALQKYMDDQAEEKMTNEAVIAEARRLSTPQYPLNHGVMATDPTRNPMNMTPELPQWNPVEALGTRRVPLSAVAKLNALFPKQEPKIVPDNARLVGANNRILVDSKESTRDKKNPPSVEEFLFAQQNPEFARFLRDRRPQTRVEINGPKVADPLLVEEGKAIQADSRKIASTWVAKAPAIARIEKSISDGMVQGQFGELRANVGKFFSLLGATNDDVNAALYNSQNASQALAELSIKTVKELGANPSNADMILQRIRSGDISNDANALYMIMQAAKADMYNTVRMHNNRAEGYLAGNPENASRLRSGMVIDTRQLPVLPIDAEAFAPQSDTGYFMPNPNYSGPNNLPKQTLFGPEAKQSGIAESRERAAIGQRYVAPDGTVRIRSQ